MKPKVVMNTSDVISFRIDETVIRNIRESGVNDVAQKVQAFLIMLLEASLDGQKECLKNIK